MNNTRVGIIGFGMVGGAVGAWFKRAAIYSPHRFPAGMKDVNDCEIVFICAPSPYSAKKGYDLSAIHQAGRALTGRKIVVLKSTVLPGTTALLQRKYPRHTWLFNPEFLRDKTAVKDFRDADRQIIGMAKNTPRHRAAAARVMRILPRAPYQAVTGSTEAELIKEFANAFGATKVVFFNMVYDLAKRLGANYEQVRLGIAHDVRIGAAWTKVLFDGYRGYSGKCFPKDMGAMIWYGRHTRHRLPLLEVADRINWKLLPRRHRHR